MKEYFFLKRVGYELEERGYILLSFWSLVDVSHVLYHIFLDIFWNFKSTHCLASHVNLLIEYFLFLVHSRQKWSHVAKNKSAEKLTKYNYERGHKCLGIVDWRYLVSNNEKNAVVYTFAVLFPGRHVEEIWFLSLHWHFPIFFGVINYYVPYAANPMS